MAAASILMATLWCVGAAAPAGTVPTSGQILVGNDTSGNQVRVHDPAGGVPVDFMPFAVGYAGGVRVAFADVNGDGRPDVIAASGPGSTPLVRSFYRQFLSRETQAYAAGFQGGVFVAGGDVDGDGRAEIITGSGPASSGSAHVKVFDVRTGVARHSFFPYAGYLGGVTVAAGDVTGDGIDDIITGAATSGQGHVKVFDGVTLAEVRSFFAFAAGFNGGVFVAGGDVNGDGRDDIVAGVAGSGPPHVKAFSGINSAEIASFFAYTPTFTGGVRVAAADLNGDGTADVMTSPGSGMAPTVNRFFGPGMTPAGSFNGFDPSYTGGVFVAADVEIDGLLVDGFEGD